MKGSEVLEIFTKNDFISYIFGMYEQYHIETLDNAFDDLDEQLGLSPMISYHSLEY